MERLGVQQLQRDTFFSAIDYYLVIPVLSITLIGLYVLNKVLSAGFKDYPVIFYKQTGAVLVGIAIALILCMIEVPTLRLVGFFIYAIGLVLLVYVLVDDYSEAARWGADSWMKLPLVGTFQPSELIKIGLAMVSAIIFEQMDNRRFKWWLGGLLLIALYVPPIWLIMKQPDFGTAMVVIFMFICMLFIWGIRWRYILIGISGAVILVPLVWLFYFTANQKDRILTFLYPGHDPAASYNLLQAQLAIAIGGLTGSKTTTPVHVPVKEADFIYTAVSEHMGFIGTTALIVLIFLFLGRCLYVSSRIRTRQPAASYMVVGLTAGLAFHYIENLGMCVGLLPITGIPLPFVSLGGTAMVVNYIALGVILSASMERNTAKSN
jgi:rod shape determining protein RodA